MRPRDNAVSRTDKHGRDLTQVAPSIHPSATATPATEQCASMVMIQNYTLRCGQRMDHQGVHSANLDGEGTAAVLQWMPLDV